MKFNLFTAALASAVLLCGVLTPASAGTKDDVRDLQERMARMEQSMAALSATTVRMAELENQLQQLTGQIEELSYQLDQANARLDAVSAALATGAPGSGGALSGVGPNDFGAAQGPVDLSTGDPIAGELQRPDSFDIAAPASVELPLNPDAAFDYASGFLLQGDYPRAKAAFSLYVDAFPNHPRTPDAQFRLGEIYLALGENTEAADAFIAHIRNYPSDPRAAEAYLKLGTAFSRLERPDEACTVFQTMKTKYPNAGGPVTQRADLEMARIDCN